MYNTNYPHLNEIINQNAPLVLRPKPKIKFLFFLELNYYATSVLCCFTLDTGIFLIGWLGLISSCLELAGSSIQYPLSILSNIYKIYMYGLLIKGRSERNNTYLKKAYYLKCVLFYFVVILIIISLIAIKTTNFSNDVSGTRGDYNQFSYNDSGEDMVINGNRINSSKEYERHLNSLIYYSALSVAWIAIFIQAYFVWVIYSYLYWIQVEELEMEIKRDRLIPSNEYNNILNMQHNYNIPGNENNNVIRNSNISIDPPGNNNHAINNTNYSTISDINVNSKG